MPGTKPIEERYLSREVGENEVQVGGGKNEESNNFPIGLSGRDEEPDDSISMLDDCSNEEGEMQVQSVAQLGNNAEKPCSTLVIKANGLVQIGEENYVEFVNDSVEDTGTSNVDAGSSGSELAIYKPNNPLRSACSSKKSRNTCQQEIESSENRQKSRAVKLKQKTKYKRDADQAMTPPLLVLKNTGLPDSSPSTKKFLRISDEIMEKLQKCRDNGDWCSFDFAKQKLVVKYSDNKEAMLAIRLEESVEKCYRKKLILSEEILLDVIREAATTENAPYLIGRAYLYLSGVDRKMGNMTGMADYHTQEAEDIFCTLRSITLDSTFTAYERACVLMDFSANFPNPKPWIKEKAKECLKRCIDISLKLEEDDDNPRYIKKHQFAFIKMAIMLLDCRTAAGRKKIVSQSDIKEAEDCLIALQKYCPTMAEGQELQYYLAMSDLKLRQGKLSEAWDFASTALSRARDLGFGTEIEPAEERCAEISLKIEKSSAVHRPPIPDFDAQGLSSDDHFGGSSSCDTDDLLSSSEL